MVRSWMLSFSALASTRTAFLRDVISALVAASLVLGAGVSPVLGRFENWDVYTYANSNCTGIKDPLNFFYEENLGHVADALAVTQGAPLNWGYSNGSDQWMFNGGQSPGDQCARETYQRASAILSPRYHTRLEQGSYVDQYVQLSTASPMHHDSLNLTCGDYADSFNSARDHARSLFVNAGYALIRTYVGNTMAIRQCDGTMTASDGYVYRNTGK